MVKNNLLFLVDDDPIFVFITRKILEKLGQRPVIEVFGDGKAGFDELSKRLENHQELPGIILLDLNMPVWDGWDFLDECRKLMLPPEMQIYIVTSSKSPEDMKRTEQFSDVTGYLVKPLQEETLAALFHRET